MRLVYYDIPAGNFGDDLNWFLWPRLLPDAFSGATRMPMFARTESGPPGEDLFVGIGTLIMQSLPSSGRRLVFGSGAGYGLTPDRDEQLKIYFVRGPLTAQKLGLDARLAITDPAILVRLFPPAAQATRYKISFMPHWIMAESGVWQQICHALDIHFIDPRWPPLRVIRNIAETEILVAEALHGAIVADALRVPWVPVTSGKSVLPFKWQDWCRTIGVPYEPVKLPAIWNPRRGIASHLVTIAKDLAGEVALARVISHPAPLLSNSGVNELLTERVIGVLDGFARERSLKLELSPHYASPVAEAA